MKTVEKDAPLLEQLPVAQMTTTPMSMLERAVVSGASIEVLEKLMGLQERFEANHARKAFDEAVSAAKKEIPPIQRNATGHNSKKYADFAAIAKVVDPIIGAHGLSYRFRTTQTDKIAVTCILSHKAGHSEETTLCGPADATGNKNAIQAIGSTLTYLQRYSLVQMLGLAAAQDDDGKGAASDEVISQEQLDALRKLIDEIGADVQKTCVQFKIDGLALLPASRYDEATLRLKQWAKAQQARAK